MAKILVRTVDGENALRYMAGDPVIVVPDDHIWGRAESLEVWLAEGRDATEWPGGFAIVEMPGVAPETLVDLIAEQCNGNGAMTRRRKKTIAYNALERRQPGSGRDTLRTLARISRAAADVAAAIADKA